MARIIGGSLREVCPDCGEIVRIDKPVLGSLHICTLPQEREKYADQIARRAEHNRVVLKNAK
jgi:hypothetical protein